jgi:putative ABC transport system permease protein
MFNRNFDTQSAECERTYRVLYTRAERDDIVSFASCSPPVGPVMKENFPGVETFSRMFKFPGIFYTDQNYFEEEQVFFAESALFDLLGLKIIAGESENCLDEPSMMAISASTALKYFGEHDPVGQIMKLNNHHIFQVSAVFEDFPPNTHFKADIFLSLETYNQWHPQVLSTGWINSGFYTYVRLKHGTDPEQINLDMSGFIQENFGEALNQRQLQLIYTLQPIRDIHLNSRLMHELDVNNDKTSINLLAIISWFILVIAWMNYFNLSTIASLRRLKEIGVRKVNGASRNDIIKQLLFESFLVNLFAFLLAFLLIEILNPGFNSFAGLPSTSRIMTESWFFVYVTIIFLAGVLSSGVYSSTRLGSNKLTAILKGTHSIGKGNSEMRKILVSFQFIIAIALISSTIIVYSQHRFMVNRDLGFRLHDMMVVKAPRVGGQELASGFTSFCNELRQIAGISNASFSSVIPGKSNMFNRGGFFRVGDQDPSPKNMRVTEVDENFFDTFQIKFLAGEGFTGNPETDQNRVVLNYNAAILMGFEDELQAINQKITLGERIFDVSGVVTDFHQLSPKEATEPQIFWRPVRNQGYFTINYTNMHPQDLIKIVEGLYDSFFPGNPYVYLFLDEYYNLQFLHDQRFGSVLGLFSLMVGFVTILGLIGLSAYTAEQRKKEIGIRKIIGASQGNIFLLLFRNYITLWIIASVISVPLAWYFMTRWLNNFFMRMTPDLLVFIIPALIVLIVCLLTVVIISMRIVRLNPVESIKYE